MEAMMGWYCCWNQQLNRLTVSSSPSITFIRKVARYLHNTERFVDQLKEAGIFGMEIAQL
jgi:hypothetical protein